MFVLKLNIDFQCGPIQCLAQLVSSSLLMFFTSNCQFSHFSFQVKVSFQLLIFFLFWGMQSKHYCAVIFKSKVNSGRNTLMMAIYYYYYEQKQKGNEAPS